MNLFRKKSAGSLRSAIFYSSIESVCEQVIVFVTGIILARNLEPESYGICGVLMVFVTISQGLIDAGLGASLIYHRNPRYEYRDSVTVFWINVLFSLICYAVLFATAGLIADFNKTPEMRGLLRVLALLIIINAFGLVQKSLLRKKLNILPIAASNIVGYVIGGGIGIACAFRGMEAWSLVYYRLSKTTIEVLILYCCSSWRPRLIFCFERAMVLFRYGIIIAVQGIVENLFNNIHTLIIGHFYGMSDTGFFSRAQSLVSMPQVFLLSITGRVYFPYFASQRNNLTLAKEKFTEFITVLCTLLMIALGALWVVAAPVVQILLTDKWAAAAPLIRILCLFMWAFPILNTTNALLNGIGAASAVVRLTVVQKTTMLVIALICTLFPLKIFAFGIGIGVLLNVMFGLYVVNRHVSLNLFHIAWTLGARLICIALICYGLFSGMERLNLGAFARVAAAMLVGGCCALTYMGIVYRSLVAKYYTAFLTRIRS